MFEGKEVYCNKECPVKLICQKNINLTIKQFISNEDLATKNCILKNLIENLKEHNSEV